MPTNTPPDEKLYLFKPPPPYPGTSGSGSSSNAAQQKVDMTNSPSTTSAETPVIVSKEQSQSIKMGTSVSRIPPTDISGSSRSVPSAVSVVSAEVHNVPNGKERQSAKEKSGAAGSAGGVTTKSVHGPVPKTNGLLKEGNGTRKSSATMHSESKVKLVVL